MEGKRASRLLCWIELRAYFCGRRREMKAIGADLTLLALASTTSPAQAGSDDVYFFWCWNQAAYVRPALKAKRKRGARTASLITARRSDTARKSARATTEDSFPAPGRRGRRLAT